MKRFLLIFLCFFLFISCSSTVKTNTLLVVDIKPEIEVLPVTADLSVYGQKVSGEASGKDTDLGVLQKQAIAKALGQEPPSVERPDLLVGLNAYTEVNGSELKVIVTGYPAYYTNFRTATEEDSLRLNMVNSGAFSELQEDRSSKWYFSGKYHFGKCFGFGLGLGIVWSNGFFLGIDGDQGGFIENEDRYGGGGGLTVGGIYELPYQFKLVFGSSAGFWYSEESYDVIRYDSYSGYSYRNSEYEDYVHVLSPFIRLRWHGIEAGLRMFMIPETDLYFTVGFTF